MSARYVYGIHAVDSLLRERPGEVQQLLLQAGREDKRITALLDMARNQGVAIARESRAGLDKRVSGRHQGAVALLADVAPGDVSAAANLWRESELLDWVKRKDGPVLVLVLDGVTDPHNLGACLRSADAAGADAVVVPRDNAADLTPVARKVACGAAEVLPFVRVTNISRTLQALQAAGVWVYGTDDQAEKSIYNSELTGSLALVMGAEGKGLRRLTKETCDHLIQIPMQGSVSSLNVSVAAGICLFEAARQRAALAK